MLSRIMMNAELVSNGEIKIIIATDFRSLEFESVGILSEGDSGFI